MKRFLHTFDTHQEAFDGLDKFYEEFPDSVVIRHRGFAMRAHEHHTFAPLRTEYHRECLAYEVFHKLVPHPTISDDMRGWACTRVRAQ